MCPMKLPPEMVDTVFETGAPCDVDADIAPTFKVGDKVRLLNLNKPTHHRIPQYLKGRVGRIATDHGVFITPDTNAYGQGENPQHVYSVVFESTEVWGDAGNPRDRIYADVWDDYMELEGA